jgi:ABC-2 type transport system permease protein
MTTSTKTPIAPAAVSSRLTGRGLRVTQLRVLHSEWTKLRSLRSTIVTLLAAIVLFVGLGMMRSYFTVHRWDQLEPAERLHFDSVNVALTGVFLAQLAIGVLGVLLVTGEYSSGMIGATFGAVPRRLPVLWAKLIIFAAVAMVTMTVAAFVAFYAAQGILGTSSHHLTTTLGHAGVLRALFGAAGYLTFVGMIGVGLGALLRSTAGAISTLAGLLFVLPALVNVLPQNWNDTVSPYFPAHAGESLFSLHGPDPTSLSPTAALVTMIVYVVVIVGAAAISMVSRDA